MLGDKAVIEKIIKNLLQQKNEPPYIQQHKTSFKIQLEALQDIRRNVDASGLGPAEQKKDLSNVCTWVPSATGHPFNRKGNRIVYGGVIIDPNILKVVSHSREARNLAQKAHNARTINSNKLRQQTKQVAQSVQNRAHSDNIAQNVRFHQKNQGIFAQHRHQSNNRNAQRGVSNNNNNARIGVPAAGGSGGNGNGGNGGSSNDGFFGEKVKIHKPIYIAKNLSKQEARSFLRETKTNLTQEQVKNILKQLKSGKIDSVNIKKMPSGMVHLCLERKGYISGFQRMSFKINKAGKTVRVVQTAYDDEGNLIHQAPGHSKNNLYDVKF